ncbi:MAG TPA: hypothetical protein VGL17_08340 [Gemmatimonadaceae bacterium]|jgi:hypothetical protein
MKNIFIFFTRAFPVVAVGIAGTAALEPLPLIDDDFGRSEVFVA